MESDLISVLAGLFRQIRATSCSHIKRLARRSDTMKERRLPNVDLLPSSSPSRQAPLSIMMSPPILNQ